ncbi:MAG: DUF2634 domain-containing protein [Lachnospiraceae bacterium]|jgi:phage baseplate assembly protein W|nr:DUF2634 domain-containing protein [Lachnospiraceae bacterium]
MIPGDNGFLSEDFEIEDQPTYTYKMSGDQIQGYADNLEAMKQVIYKIIHTERYQYPMYSWNYGTELSDLYGEPVSYVVPELERRITEALLWDDRITEVSDFEFDLTNKGVISVTFNVQTVFGTLKSEAEVSI